MNYLIKNLRQLIDTDDPAHPGKKRLKLQGKNLTKVPIELSHLTDLEVLVMSPEREACLFYRLSEIPIWIGGSASHDHLTLKFLCIFSLSMRQKCL
ncbi:unnamed protein product [Dibothriocephalus latus]|uniref:Uncharacterized protein n=1 Tax=Dibothriocephalus latus TaxID=60516 RepID=A0A3P7MCJ7_DIBLA|nr:unnamed protein product [Dibothriocephalus latus]